MGSSTRTWSVVGLTVLGVALAMVGCSSQQDDMSSLIGTGAEGGLGGLGGSVGSGGTGGSTPSACPAGMALCGGVCVYVENNSANCGVCGNVCPTGAGCGAGQCACTAPLVNCGSTCVDPRTDATNCGACGTTCVGTQGCVGGVCSCPPGYAACGGQCVNTATDAANCGACDAVCTGTQGCAVGVCSCPGGYTACGAQCVDASTDAFNCGACGVVCASGEQCTLGACQCQAGLTDCVGGCVDTQSSGSNCGGCGVACASGQVCSLGTCSASCAAGLLLCGSSCVDSTADLANCGACGNVCPAGQACANGECSCPAGQTDCGGQCVDTATSSVNCGGCGNACAAGQSCTLSVCSCPAGQMFCSGQCVNTATDLNNCGTCGNACLAGQTCGNGACGCPAGQTACNGQCVYTTTNPSHCGACGNACSPGQSCANGACSCPAGQTLCSGTCLSTQSDPANCGTCGNRCTAGATCSSGTCIGGTGGAGGTGGTTGGTGGRTGGTGGVTGGTGGRTGGTGGTTSGGTGGTLLGGFHQHGAWAGFAWTAVDTAAHATITPANFENLTTDGPYCASGNVPVTSDYSAIAMVGFNVNQQRIDDAPVGTWSPVMTSAGLMVHVRRIDTSTDVIRVQIQGLNGATDSNDRWCATLSQFNQDVVIAWDGFNTKCWDNSGAWYAGQPLAAAMVFVPGMGNSDASPHARTFNFCIDDIGPASGTGGTGGTGGTTGACGNGVAGSGTLSDGRYGVVHTNPNNYVIWANGWGSGFQSQSLSYNGASFTVSSANGSESGGAPFSYPSIFVGNNGQTSTLGNLPRQLSAITSVPTCVNWDGGSGEFNVAYDVWFSNNSSASNPPSAGYLMLWFHDPPNHQPVGQSVASGVSIDGRSWSVWYGTQGSARPVVSYVADGDVKSANQNLKPFFTDAVNRGYLQNSWYLITIFAGFEIWNNGSNYQMKGFSATVN